MFRLLRVAEGIKASFTHTHTHTHMFMEEVWVVFLEVIAQSILTVEADVNTMKTHLLLLMTLCDTVHEV